MSGESPLHPHTPNLDLAVVQLVCEGWNVSRIADELGVTVEEVAQILAETVAAAFTKGGER